MKISSFDLNLFVILNAIYTEGSLTKAAEVVGITQPAVSNALSRLREKFNDDLFIRTGSGMVPTQKTENMIQDVQNALTLIQQSVNEPDTFDPSATKRNFKLSLGDVSEGRVLPFIMEEIYKQAPNISIGSYAYSRSDQVHALSTNNLDFVVDPVIPRSDEINSMKVFEDDFVVMHREDHDLSKVKNPSIDDILDNEDPFESLEPILPREVYPILVLAMINDIRTDTVMDAILKGLSKGIETYQKTKS